MLTLETHDGQQIEAIWSKPDHPRAVLTFCHPHPLHQGTMLAPLMVKVTEYLTEAGVAVLRFNFRSVGASTGDHDGGGAEQLDVSAAVAEAAAYRPDLPHAVAGWSFGAATSLNWLATSGSDLPWAGIAPPVRSERTPALPARTELVGSGQKTLILGERDQFTSVDDMKEYAESIGASLSVLSSDHFFYGRETTVGALVDEALFGTQVD